MARSGQRAQGELLRGDTFARLCDFYTILPLREAKETDGRNRLVIFAKETEKCVLQWMFRFAVLTMLVDENPINGLPIFRRPVRVMETDHQAASDRSLFTLPPKSGGKRENVP